MNKGKSSPQTGLLFPKSNSSTSMKGNKSMKTVYEAPIAGVLLSDTDLLDNDVLTSIGQGGVDLPEDEF